MYNGHLCILLSRLSIQSCPILHAVLSSTASFNSLTFILVSVLNVSSKQVLCCPLLLYVPSSICYSYIAVWPISGADFPFFIWGRYNPEVYWINFFVIDFKLHFSISSCLHDLCFFFMLREHKVCMTVHYISNCWWFFPWSSLQYRTSSGLNFS